MLAIPRVGQEVLVDFLDGDPDQPIVTGRTYNAQQLPPGRLPQSKTQKRKIWWGVWKHIEGGAKIFSADADAEASANVFRGENGKYGFEGRASAQASAISAEGKACLGTEESFAMFCEKVGVSAGPSGDLGSKVIWDHKNKVLQFGVNGKFIGGGEIEGQVKF